MPLDDLLSDLRVPRQADGVEKGVEASLEFIGNLSYPRLWLRRNMWLMVLFFKRPVERPNHELCDQQFPCLAAQASDI